MTLLQILLTLIVLDWAFAVGMTIWMLTTKKGRRTFFNFSDRLSKKYGNIKRYTLDSLDMAMLIRKGSIEIGNTTIEVYYHCSEGQMLGEIENHLNKFEHMGSEEDCEDCYDDCECGGDCSETRCYEEM